MNQKVALLSAAMLVAFAMPLHAQPVSPHRVTLQSVADVQTQPFGIYFGGGLFRNHGIALDGDRLATLSDETRSGNPLAKGAVYVFRRAPGAGQWLLEQRLLGDARTADGGGEYAVAMANDLIAAGTGRNTTGGGTVVLGPQALVYRRDAGAGMWQIDAVLKGSAPAFAPSSSVDAVSLSGNEVVFAASGDPDVPGVVWVFRRNPSSGAWLETQRLLPADSTAKDYFGYSISLAGDRMAISAPNAGRPAGSAFGNGKVYLYRKNTADGPWLPNGEIGPSHPTASHIGSRILLSGDDLLVSAASGGLLQYRRTPAGTYQEMPPLVSPCPDSGSLARFHAQGDRLMVLDSGPSLLEFRRENATAPWQIYLRFYSRDFYVSNLNREDGGGMDVSLSAGGFAFAVPRYGEGVPAFNSPGAGRVFVFNNDELLFRDGFGDAPDVCRF